MQDRAITEQIENNVLDLLEQDCTKKVYVEPAGCGRGTSWTLIPGYYKPVVDQEAANTAYDNFVKTKIQPLQTVEEIDFYLKTFDDILNPKQYGYQIYFQSAKRNFARLGVHDYVREDLCKKCISALNLQKDNVKIVIAKQQQNGQQSEIDALKAQNQKLMDMLEQQRVQMERLMRQMASSAGPGLFSGTSSSKSTDTAVREYKPTPGR